MGVGLGIVHPEVVALRIGIGKVRAASAMYTLQYIATRQYAPAQINPVLLEPATNHVINGGKTQAAGIDVTMIQGGEIIRSIHRFNV